MAHELGTHGQRDRFRVNMADAEEFNAWCAEFACTPLQLKQAVGRAGVMASDVAAFFEYETPKANQTAPTNTWRARWWLIASIAASLVVLAPTWWLYRSDVANHSEMTMPAAARAGDADSAQVKQAQQQMEGQGAAYQQLLAQERVNAETLTRDLAAARREIEIQTATARIVASEAAQAKEAAERSAATVQALQEERARADTLARDLATAQREIDVLRATASAASGETTRVREDAMRAAEELQRSQQRERARADALERDLAAVHRTLEVKASASAKSAEEATRLQQTAEGTAAELRHDLQEERYKAEKLARELAAAWHELETQATSLAKTSDKTALNQELTELRQALQQAQTAAAAYQESLAQERARNEQLSQELAARRDTTPDRSRTIMASPSDTPGPTATTAPDKAATASPPKMDEPPMPAGAKPAPMVPRPTAREGPGNPEVVRLMARASLLVSQGNVGAARIVLERAAETGNAWALLALAETYDPAVLSAWGTVGTQADVAKAREFYGRALADGVHEAKDRLNALP